MKKRQKIILIELCVVLITGLSIRLFSSYLPSVINNKIGGTIYVIFWSLLAVLIFGRNRYITICLWVLLITICIEFTQLFSNRLLVSLRSNVIIRLLIGSTFNWKDIPFYFMGSLIAILLVRRLQKNE